MEADIGTVRTVLAVGVLVALLAWETLHPFFEHFSGGSPGWKRRGKHAAINLAIGIVNNLVVSFVFVAAWLAATRWATEAGFGLLHLLSLPVWAQWLVAILLLDAWTYAWHWMNHAIPILWRFHRLHHADREMDVTTAGRFHTVEISLSSVLRIPLLVLIGCSIEMLAVYEVMLFACVQFHHANIAVPERLDRALRLFIVTPFMHKVHHSVKRMEANSNYGSLFTWWDRVFRTMNWTANPRGIMFGVDDDTGGRSPRR